MAPQMVRAGERKGLLTGELADLLLLLAKKKLSHIISMCPVQSRSENRNVKHLPMFLDLSDAWLAENVFI